MYVCAHDVCCMYLMRDVAYVALNADLDEMISLICMINLVNVYHIKKEMLTIFPSLV